MSGIENFGNSGPIAKPESLINRLDASDWRAATYKPVHLADAGTLNEKLTEKPPAPTQPSATGSDASTLPAFVDSKTWPQVQSLLNNARGEVKFSTAEDNQKAGIVPDLILGADGKLRVNPDKKDPAKDGKLNIQVEAKTEAEAKKVADQLQKQAVQELISYFQKNNPKAQVPQNLIDQLNKQPEPTAQPSPGSTDDVPSGHQQVGGRDVGEAPRGGYRNGSFDSDSTPINPQDIPPPVAGDLDVRLQRDAGGNAAPSCTEQQIQEFLEKMHSPAAREEGFAHNLYNSCINHNLDPAVACGFFLQESTCGLHGRAPCNHSFGNIKGRDPQSGDTDGTYRRYQNWSAGAEDWANLIDHSYVHGRGLNYLSQIVHVYAPNGDAANNEGQYTSEVKGVVEAMKKAKNSSSSTAIA